MSGKPTVFDVARLAGVSRGTVDRVLNRQGRVSVASRDKVEKAVCQLGYERNEGAACLSRKKVLRIATLTPKPHGKDYWKQIDDGFSQGEDIVRRFQSLTLLRHHYDQTDLSSFEAAANDILEEGADGVILNFIFKCATRNLAAQFHSRNIPYAFIDTKDDDLPYVIHCGVKAQRSGALGAYLLSLAAREMESVAVVCIKRNIPSAEDPNENRKSGFVSYIREHFPECRLYPVYIDPASEDGAVEDMVKFISSHPEVKNFVAISSRTYILRKFFSSYPDKGRVVVGFDDLEGNMEALREGLVTFLVTRHIPYQSRDILVDFSRFLSGGPMPEVRDNFVHMDILSKLNIDDYK